MNPDYEQHNALISEYESRANDIIMEFERNKIEWTLDQFEDAFTSKTNHTGSAECYARTLHMLQLFDPKFEKRVF